METALHPDKIEAQKQWDTDPCGACTAQGVEPETLEFYREVRRYRYEDYGPWFHRVIGFDQVRDKEVLEIGVGVGSDHFSFARNGNRMTGLDLSREHLRHTQRHLALEGYSTTPIYGDAEDMPFPDNSFDVVYSFGVLMSTPDTPKAFSEVHRVLRPGGVALIGIYNRNSWFFWVNTFLVHGIVKMGLIRKGWRKLLSEIEYRSDNNAAVPLVKVYSRRNLRKFSSPFSRVEITSCHVDHGHFSRLRHVLRPIPREWMERHLGFGGWYLVVRAEK
ncbi:MAG TPA: methyltransferase domain-containing protein [Candidatus Angelobacter sp.]|jgi:ubiquinone/menaquinone biosynthesis C-methylase UbiE